MMTLIPGDIVKIDLPEGPAFVQVLHNHPAYPEVVRVLSPPEHRITDAAALAQCETQFVAMVPLSSAIGTAGLSMQKIGNGQVPEALKRFPTFKMSILDKHEGKRGAVAYWWFWDGDGLRYDTEAGADVDAIPRREVLSIDDFLGRIRAVQLPAS